MENDSLNVLDSSVVENVSGGSDSAVGLVSEGGVESAGMPDVQMPTPEQLGISITTGSGEPLSVAVGDTFEFPVTVSWSVNGSALLVVPTGSVSAKGLAQVGVSQESARMVKDGKEMASITFNYKIAAQDTGDLSIPVMRFDIPTQVGTSLTLRSESVPVRVNEPSSGLPFLVGGVVAIAVVVAGVLRMKRRAKARAEVAVKKAAAEELKEQMIVLKRRVTTADSREWLLDLEKVCKVYAAGRFGGEAGKINLEVLAKEGRLEGWDGILEEFAHARYGGGKRDGFENKETWKAAAKLMNIEEE